MNQDARSGPQGPLNRLTDEQLKKLSERLPTRWKGPGRPPERIPAMLQVLTDLWKRYPDLRLGQLILNATGNVDIYNIEDDEMMRLLTTYYPEGGFGVAT